MLRSAGTHIALTTLAGAVLVMAGAMQDRSHLPLVLAAASVAGIATVWLWRQNSLSVREVLAYAVLFRLLLFPIPPSLSDDSYRYVWDGLVTASSINPYQYTPDDAQLSGLQSSVVYTRLNSPSWYSVYPPVSQYIFALGAPLHKYGWVYSYFGIKAVFLLLELLAVILMARIVQVRWLTLYALNPVILIETAGQAHTESAMVLLLVLTLLFAWRGNGRSASVVLACAGWVKLYPFMLLPFLWRRFRWAGLWPGITTTILLALPFAAPGVIGNVLGSLDLYSRFFEFNAGLYYGMKKVMLLITGDDWSKRLGPLLRYCFVVSLPIVYYLDSKFRWTLARAFLVTLGSYVVFSTTVHPWYLVGIVALAAVLESGTWHWLWLGTMSLGTYLTYVGGPYSLFVFLGWSGWLILACWRHGPTALQQVLRYRAWRKWRFARPFFPRSPASLSVLDLGAGEGYVGERISREIGAEVIACDVIDLNRTTIPYVLYEGHKLPWEDAKFDVVLLYYVLHHASDQESAVREALRVANGRVIVVEPCYDNKTSRWLMKTIDVWANRLRSWGRMMEQEEAVRYRTPDEWTRLFKAQGAEMLAHATRGGIFERKVLYVLGSAGVQENRDTLG